MYKLSMNSNSIDVFRRAKRAAWLSSCLLAILVWTGSAFAQPNARVLRTEPSSPNEKLTFWLYDENGSWRVPLPNWTLEDVMNAVDAREEESAATPYTIQSVDANGKVEDGVARMTVQFAVDVADGAVRVPLGLKEGVYIPTREQEESGQARTGGFSYQGPGFVALDVDPESGEYVAIVQSQTRRFRRRTVGGQGQARPADSRQDANNTENANSESAPASEPANDASNAPAPAKEQTDAAPAPETKLVESPAQEQPAETPVSGVENPEPAPAQETSGAQESAPTQTTAAPEEASPAVPEAASEESTAEPVKEARMLDAAVERAYADSVDEPQDSQTSAAETNREDAVVGRLRPNQYVLTLELCFVVETVSSDEFRLEASFPASGRSQLTLETPLSNVVINSVKGAVAMPLVALSETSTELKLRGLGRGGERTELAWRKTDSESDESLLVYQVEDATIDVALSARETAYDVALPVRAYGGESDVFYVRLPERASLIVDSVVATGLNGALYAVKSVHETSEAALANEGRGSDPNETPSDVSLVEIRLEQKTSSVVLKLKARVQIPDTPDSVDGAPVKRPARQIAGFSVVDAQKQYGRVKVTKSVDLDFDVSASYGAALSSDSALVGDEENYSFFSQPFLLTAQEYKRQMIVNVKPEYQATVGVEASQLRARFHYFVYGAKAKEFKIRLNDWSLLYIASDDAAAINSEAVYRNATTGETVFPLSTPADGEIVFELALASDSKPNKEENGLFTSTLPTPIADWVEPAAVVVAPENNVELEPLVERFVGLEAKSSRAFSLDMELPKLVQAPLYYQASQVLGSSNENQSSSIFVANVRQLEQKLEVSARTDATISENGEIHVRQDFIYNIDYEPLEVASISQPLAMLEPTNKRFAMNVKFFVDGKAVPQQNLRVVSKDDEQHVVRQILMNDSPKIGSCVVTVQYDFASDQFQPDATNYVDLTLMQPTEDSFLYNELNVTVPDGVSLEYSESDSAFWKLEYRGMSTDGVSWNARYRSVTRETNARFGCLLSAGGKDSQGVAIVERAWIQSWFSNNARVDRAAYRISCERDSFTIQLPNGVRKDRVAVTLDKQPIKNVADPERGLFVDDAKISVPISEELKKREFVLEVSYVVPNSSVNPIRTNARTFVQLPRFDEETTWVRRSYWQAIVPGDRHLVNAPKNWTSEYFVKRESGLGFFSRVASTSSEELSEWIGIDNREKIPTGVNVYLFSSFSLPPTSGFYMIDRSLLVLIGSGVALLFGLGLIYIPSVRTPSILFVLSVIALAVAAFQPTLALLFLQTTVVGVVLTLVTAFVAVMFGQRKPSQREAADAKKRLGDLARANGEGA